MLTYFLIHSIPLLNLQLVSQQSCRMQGSVVMPEPPRAELPLCSFATQNASDLDALCNGFVKVKQRLLSDLPGDTPDAAEHYCKACEVLGIKVDELLLSQLVDPEVGVLDLTTTYIAPNTLLALCCAVERLPSVRKVAAANSRLSTPMVCFLCACLATTKTVEVVDFSHNPIGSEVASFVYRLARVNYRLRVAELDGVEMIPSLFRKINSQLAINATTTSRVHSN